MMIANSNYKKVELLCLFVALPVLLATGMELAYKVTLGVIGVGYCVWLSWNLKLIGKTDFLNFPLRNHLLRILITFLLVIISTAIFMWATAPLDLFIVVKESPVLWVVVVVLYSVFSVLPQELIYRSFFFNRYFGLFKSGKVLVVINILIFPIAHLLFHNYLVLLATLIGGIFFTVTYNRSKSLLLTSLEHALYGSWLFTIGMGEMLAFPMP